MKIYTKTGDKGTTALIGGQRVSKTHERLEAYGSIDELNAWIGLIADQNMADKHKMLLHTIQNKLFTVGSHLATQEKEIAAKLPQLSDDDVVMLEEAMDKMSETLPELHTFVLPGGSTVSSYCHIARTVCRRAERQALKIADTEQSPQIFVFINRLSDYLFVLARTLVYECGGEELLYNPL